MASLSSSLVATRSEPTLIGWLLDSDPSIRWQVLRDLTDAPQDAVAAEHAKIASEGLGTRLLAMRAADGL